MASRRQKRVSPTQQETIISFLANNEKFKTKKFSAGFTSDDLERLWENLSQKLNGDGTGPSKSIEKWKKMLTDWKSNTKGKSARIKKSMNATGGGEKTTETLTDIEERFLAVYGRELTDGIPQTEEYGISCESPIGGVTPSSSGINTTSTQKNCSSSDDINEPSCSSNKLKESEIYLGLEEFSVEEESDSNQIGEREFIDSNAERKRNIETAAENSLAKRQKRMNEGKSQNKKPKILLAETSAILEKLQESQNDVFRDMANSLSRHAKAKEDIAEQQKELVKLKIEKNLIAKLQLANQKRINDHLLSLIQALTKKK